MSNPTPNGGIIRKEIDGYNCFIKDDGVDYAQIWQQMRGGRLPSLTTLKEISHRKVYLAHIENRQYLIKIDTKCPKRFDMKLWRILHGPVHSRHMKAVNRAVQHGCTITQDVFFVAEKKGLICPESFIILEYLPGRTLSGNDLVQYREAVGSALAELHRYGLSSSDIHPGNFLVTDEKIKVIDLSTKGVGWAGKGRDIIDAKEIMGVDVPVQGPVEWLAVLYVRLKRLSRALIKKIRSV